MFVLNQTILSLSLPSEQTFENTFVNSEMWCTKTWKNFGPFIKIIRRAQRLINLEIPVLVQSLESSNIELG